MRKHPIFRFLSLAIVACLLLSFAAPVQAAGTLTWAEVEHTRSLRRTASTCSAERM